MIRYKVYVKSQHPRAGLNTGTFSKLLICLGPFIVIRFILESEPSTRQGTLGIRGKPLVAFPGPNIPHPGNKAMHK